MGDRPREFNPTRQQGDTRKDTGQPSSSSGMSPLERHRADAARRVQWQYDSNQTEQAKLDEFSRQLQPIRDNLYRNIQERTYDEWLDQTRTGMEDPQYLEHLSELAFLGDNSQHQAAETAFIQSNEARQRRYEVGAPSSSQQGEITTKKRKIEEINPISTEYSERLLNGIKSTYTLEDHLIRDWEQIQSDDTSKELITRKNVLNKALITVARIQHKNGEIEEQGRQDWQELISKRDEFSKQVITKIAETLEEIQQEKSANSARLPQEVSFDTKGKGKAIASSSP